MVKCVGLGYEYLSDNAVAVRSGNLILHFRDILKRKQVSGDRFIVRLKFKPKVSESEPSVAPEVVELATELEIVSVEQSTGRSVKEK